MNFRSVLDPGSDQERLDEDHASDESGDEREEEHGPPPQQPAFLLKERS
jgi:hypothetical protein